MSSNVGKLQVAASGKVHVKLLQEAPAFCGGPLAAAVKPWSSSGKDELPQELDYSSLKRKATLRDSSTYDGLRPFRNLDAETVFLRLYDEGDFYMKWEFEVGESDTKLGLFLLPFEGDNPVSIQPMESFKSEPVLAATIFELPNGSSTGISHTAVCEDFKTMFTIDQTDFLMLRVTHTFLRQHAASIPVPKGNRLFCFIGSNHTSTYTQNGLWSDLLDMNMVTADLLLRTGSNQTACTLLKFAEALETRGRFEKAACVYDDIVEIVSKPKLCMLWDGEPSEMHARNCAALAYKRSGDFDMSLQAYINTIHLHYNQHHKQQGSFWDFTAPDSYTLFFNFASMLDHFRDLGRGNVHYYFPVFFGLLSKAKFPISVRNFGQMGLETKKYRELLKPQVQRKAKKCLKDLFVTPHVQDFDAKVMSYVSPTKQVRPPVTTSARTKKEHKGDARNFAVGSEENNPPNYGSCDNPHCPSGPIDVKQLKKCTQCGAVLYCGKKCQIVHWKSGHKKECPRIAMGMK